MEAPNQNTRFHFMIDGVKTYFKNAPIGWSQVEQKIKRAKKTDGLMLDVLQNLKFVKDERAILINQDVVNGSKASIKLVREEKYANDYVVTNSGYVDINTLDFDDKTASVDFVENELDKTLRDNLKTKFELDRTTDLKGRTIDSLVREKYIYKPREIFLRSEFSKEAYYENIVKDEGITKVALFTPKMDIVSSSDEDNASVLVNSYPYIFGDDLDISAASMFHINASREKHLKLEINTDVDVIADNGIITTLALFDFPEGVINIDDPSVTGLELIPQSSSTSITYNDTIEYTLAEGHSLAIISVIVFYEGTITTHVKKSSITQTEDSIYVANNPDDNIIDCINLKDAFKRTVKIIDKNLYFQSDFLDVNWVNLPVFSGETLRHMKTKNDETGTTKIVPLLTTSFQELFDFLYTITPVTFFLERQGLKNIVRIEAINYAYDKISKVNLGVVNSKQISTKVNPEKKYSSVRIGFSNSGKNEDVAGYLATNTVTEYKLPYSGDNEYSAVNSFITDPTEIELTFRKQYRNHPDEDTRLDKSVIGVDCNFENGYYIAREWQEDFSSIKNIYSRDTGYNYRLTPANCLYRHGKNFKQEYEKQVYSNDSISYLNSIGNSAFSTTLLNSVEREENGTFLINTFERAIYGTQLITIKVFASRELVRQINSGASKKNYYTAIRYQDYLGNEFFGYATDITIKDDIKLEIYNGI